jgi:hypothetical protein
MSLYLFPVATSLYLYHQGGEFGNLVRQDWTGLAKGREGDAVRHRQARMVSQLGSWGAGELGRWGDGRMGRWEY